MGAAVWRVVSVRCTTRANTTVQSVAVHHSGVKTNIQMTKGGNSLATDFKAGDKVIVSAFEATVKYCNSDGSVDVVTDGSRVDCVPAKLVTKVHMPPTRGQIIKFTKSGNRYLVNYLGNLQSFTLDGSLNHAQSWETVNPGGKYEYTVL